MSAPLRPPDDLVMIVDGHNVAHVLLPEGERPVFSPTLCGGRRSDLAALRDLHAILAAPWSLLTNPQYRAWPPWPCQTCTRLASDAEGVAPEGCSQAPEYP